MYVRVYVCMCVCVFFMFVIQRITYTAEIEAWLFSLLINIQCERFVSILFLSPLPGFPPALITYASFPTSLLPLSPRHFLSLTCSSNPIRSLWQHTLASDQVLAFLTNIRRPGITTSLGSAGYRFRAHVRNGRRRRENTSPDFAEKSLPPASIRVALRKIKIPLDRDGRQRGEWNSFVLAARGSRTRKG